VHTKSKKSTLTSSTQQTTPFTTISPTRILKARKLYRNTTSTFTPLRNKSIINEMIYLEACFGLFEYITNGIQGMNGIFDEALKRHAKGTISHELLSTIYIYILYSHTSHQFYTKITETNIHNDENNNDSESTSTVEKIPIRNHTHPYTNTPPSVLRDLLYEAMHQYPNNKYFLSIFIQTEAKSKVENRIRRFFDSLPHTASPLVYIFSLESERNRSGAENRIISTFEKALDQEAPTSTSVIIWKEYLKWLGKKGSLARLKQVVYRALRKLPWVKQIWALAMTSPIAKCFTKRELKDLYSLAIEKDIRIRNEIEIPLKEEEE